mmetsp:Transcript_10607/g.29274  ORF Transcript_10607/g.29274 Transcript_10607/m.29274 type:complete len:258 (+) Transcript_10607:470-1243(+)
MESTRCADSLQPRVVTAIACVSPRVNSAEPWVLGSMLARLQMGRTSRMPRPSARYPSRRTRFLIMRDSTRFKAIDTVVASYLPGCVSWVSPSARMRDSFTFSLMIATASPRTFFSEMVLYASSISAPICCVMISSSPSGGDLRSSVRFSLPRSAAHTSIAAHCCAMASCPSRIALSISSSVRKSQKPSIMSTASRVPAIIRSSVLDSICATVGFTTNWPSTRPTRTPATAFFMGTSDNASAAPAAVIASGSGECSKS